MKEAFELIRKRMREELTLYEKAINIVSEVEAEYGNGWIDVKDKLPKNTDDVLVTTAYGLVIDAYLSTQKNWCFRNGTRITDLADMPIAWMPLPEPYKPEKGA